MGLNIYQNNDSIHAVSDYQFSEITFPLSWKNKADLWKDKLLDPKWVTKLEN